MLHFLLFGLPPDQAAKTGTLVTLVADGTPSTQAVEQVFGGLEAVENAYMQHLRKPLMPYSRLKVETRIVASAFTTRVLGDAEAATARAAFHTVMGRPAEAKAFVAESRRVADTAAAFEVDAMLADRERNREAALTALTRAEELGTTNFYALYRLAVLGLPQNPEAAALRQAEQRLQKAVDLNPFHAPALATLANVIGMGPAEARARAPQVAEKAVMLAPRDVFARMALARALWNTGQRDVAMAHGRAAITLAKSDDERRQTQQLLDFFTKSRATPLP